MTVAQRRLGRQYAKLCDLADWDDEAVLGALREILPERDPRTHIERKVWEFAMLALVLEDTGLLRDDVEALAVGAGNERMIFWLANRLGRVVATDIYGEGDFADREALSSMLTDPASHTPFPYREERLEVRWMDGRELDFPDASFDVVFSLSSIEHFGTRDEIRRSAREMARVLRPGGVAVVMTDCIVRLDRRFSASFTGERIVRLRLAYRHDRLRHPYEAFTPRELRREIVKPSGLELMQRLDLRQSAASWDNVTRSLHGGRLAPATGSFYPHLMVETDHTVHTSVCLPLAKPP